MEFAKDSVKKIYAGLADKESKEIFGLRILYNLTDDFEYMAQILRKIAPNELLHELQRRIADLSERKVVYYGCGKDAAIIRILCPDVQMELMCDRDIAKQSRGFYGIPVISPKELFSMDDIDVAVTSSMYHKEIIEELTVKGKIQQSRIVDLGEILDEMNQKLYKTQYFEKGIVAPVQNEVFVDGGCYNGHTDILFSEWTDSQYKKIYAFEPDYVNFEGCLKSINEKLENVEVINAGVWSEDTTLSFIADHEQWAKVGEGTDTVTITAKSIDSVVKDDKVTFIKLDVEGSELEALKGAKNTIVNNRPRLAICLYHKPEDIVEIPEYILSLIPDYKIYIRHYQLSQNETILYAV